QGRLTKQFAITIAVSVLISAFNALTLSPALAAMLLKPQKHTQGVLGRFFGGFNRWVKAMTDRYVSGSPLGIRRAVGGVAMMVLFAALTGVLGRRLPTSFVPAEGYGYGLVNIQLPPAPSLERTDAVLRKVDTVLLRHRDTIENFNMIGGFSLGTRVTARNNGFYFFCLMPSSERPLDAEQLVQRLNGEFRRDVPEAIVVAVMPPAIPG